MAVDLLKSQTESREKHQKKSNLQLGFLPFQSASLHTPGVPASQWNKTLPSGPTAFTQVFELLRGSATELRAGEQPGQSDPDTDQYVFSAAVALFLPADLRVEG